MGIKIHHYVDYNAHFHHDVAVMRHIKFIYNVFVRKGGLHTTERQYLETLGERVKRFRIAKGYSQDRLALEADFSRGTLYKIENGSVNPQILTLAKIAWVLGVPMRKLIDLDWED